MPDEPAGPTLSPRVREFLRASRFMTLATLGTDGAPRTAVVWYRLDAAERGDGPATGHLVVVNSAEGRRWPADLRRDPRVALSIVDQADGYRWLGATGRVVDVIDDQAIAQADIAEMARRYHADDPEKAERLIAERFQLQQRVTFRIRLDHVHDHLE